MITLPIGDHHAPLFQRDGFLVRFVRFRLWQAGIRTIERTNKEPPPFFSFSFFLLLLEKEGGGGGKG